MREQPKVRGKPRPPALVVVVAVVAVCSREVKLQNRFASKNSTEN